MRNRVLPSYIGDAWQPFEPDGEAVRRSCEPDLTQGVVADGSPPQAGQPLITYDTGNDTNVANSLALAPSITGAQLAAIDPRPPEVSNGIPLALSALGSPVDDDDKIDGISFNEFFGKMAADAGSRLSDARNGQEVQQSLVAQAKDLPQQLSGISLDEEATLPIQFQRGYQAVFALHHGARSARPGCDQYPAVGTTLLSNLGPAAEFFLANMERVQERLRNATRQVSSGKRLTAPSDAPDEVAPLLQLRASLERN